jgi:putative ABC transport system permease protein
MTATALRPGRLGLLDVVRIGGRGLARGACARGHGLGISIDRGDAGGARHAESSRATLLAELDRIGSNLLTVAAGRTFLGEDSKLPTTAAAMADRIGPVDGAAGVTGTTATVRRTDQVSVAETGGIAVQAADPNLLTTLNGSSRGRFLDAAIERYPAVVLGAVAAERLGIRSLETPVLVWMGERWWSVVGILDPLPLAPEIDRSALVGRAAAETLLGADEAPTTIYVRVQAERIGDVRRVLAATVDPEHPEAVEVSRPSDAIEARAAAATAFTTLFLGLGAVAVLVGGLGIANVMLMAVLERRREIGLRRALGATRAHVVGQFLTEAVLLAGLGGILGAAAGAIIAAGYATSRAGWWRSRSSGSWRGSAARRSSARWPGSTRPCGRRTRPRRTRSATDGRGVTGGGAERFAVRFCARRAPTGHALDASPHAFPTSASHRAGRAPGRARHRGLQRRRRGSGRRPQHDSGPVGRAHAHAGPAHAESALDQPRQSHSRATPGRCRADSPDGDRDARTSADAIRDEPLPPRRLRRAVHLRVVRRGEPADGPEHGDGRRQPVPGVPGEALGDGPGTLQQDVPWRQPGLDDSGAQRPGDGSVRPRLGPRLRQTLRVAATAIRGTRSARSGWSCAGPPRGS